MMQTNCINLQSRLAAEFKAYLEGSHGVTMALWTGFGLMLVNVNPSGDSATHSITGSSYRQSLNGLRQQQELNNTFAVAGLTSNANTDSGDRWTTSIIPYQIFR